MRLTLMSLTFGIDHEALFQSAGFCIFFIPWVDTQGYYDISLSGNRGHTELSEILHPSVAKILLRFWATHLKRDKVEFQTIGRPGLHARRSKQRPRDGHVMATYSKFVSRRYSQ